MTDEQIALLKTAMGKSRVLWIPDSNTAREIKHIGPGPKMQPPDVDEPGEVAYLEGMPSGQYIALYNCDPREFFAVSQVF